MASSYTKYLMGFSALLMFMSGALLTFAPTEVIHAAGGSRLPLLEVLAQICGALYLAFAVLNWMAKDNLIGGIYSRPVALGNFLHFFVVSMTLLKEFPSLPKSAATFAVIVMYASLAVCFGSVLFRHPKMPA